MSGCGVAHPSPNHTRSPEQTTFTASSAVSVRTPNIPKLHVQVGLHGVANPIWKKTVQFTVETVIEALVRGHRLRRFPHRSGVSPSNRTLLQNSAARRSV